MIIVILPRLFFVYQLSYFIYSTGTIVEGLVNRAIVVNIGFIILDGCEDGFRCGSQGGWPRAVHARVNRSHEAVVARRRYNSVFQESQRISTQWFSEIVSFWFSITTILLSLSSVKDQHRRQSQSGQFEVVVLIRLGVSSGHAPKLKQFPVV